MSKTKGDGSMRKATLYQWKNYSFAGQEDCSIPFHFPRNVSQYCLQLLQPAFVRLSNLTLDSRLDLNVINTDGLNQITDFKLLVLNVLVFFQIWHM